MLPCSNQGLGENIGFPDVCNTPIGTGTAPLPYPNLGSNAMGLPFLPTCFLSLMPGHNQMAKPMMTNGDNAGVAHSSFMMMGGNNLGNIRVLLTGGPAETLLNPTQGNNYNCSTNAKLVPSITNILMSDLGGPNFAPRADLIGDTAWLEWRRCTLASCAGHVTRPAEGICADSDSHRGIPSRGHFLLAPHFTRGSGPGVYL